MKTLLIILLFLFSKFSFSQAVSLNGDPIRIFLISPVDGLKSINDSTIGISNDGIEMKKIKWQTGAGLNYNNGVLSATASTGSGSVTDYRVVILTGSSATGKTVAFPNIPASYADYLVIKNGIKILEPIVEYTTDNSKNIITLLIKCYAGDRIRYQKIK